MKKKIFFSYNFNDKKEVELFFQFLSTRYRDEYDLYFYDKRHHDNSWDESIDEFLKKCDYFLFFRGQNSGYTQMDEMTKAIKIRNNRRVKEKKPFICVINIFSSYNTDNATKITLNNANRTLFNRYNIAFDKCYMEVLKDFFLVVLNKEINYGDDLPTESYLFEYEKDIIDFYIQKSEIEGALKDPIANPSSLESEAQVIQNFNCTTTEKQNIVLNEIRDHISKGLPPDWPDVIKKPSRASLIKAKNPLGIDNVGEWRDDKLNRVIPAALTKFHTPTGICFCNNASISFPEAGPRDKIFIPDPNMENSLNVGIVVSGGIAPGINAVIDGITQRHFQYAGGLKMRQESLKIFGFKNGFSSLVKDNEYCLLVPDESTYVDPQWAGRKVVTSTKVNVGGSLIGTSRFEDLLDKTRRMETFEQIVQNLKRQRIRILYVIGGDGSMKAAHTLQVFANRISKESHSDPWDLIVIGIPKTMDNDILWVWQTFGFLSSVEKAREFIDYIAVEVESNPRIGIIQLFGSNSGFVVSHAVLASRSNICDVALIPEIEFTLEDLQRHLTHKMKTRDHGLIIMAETAIPMDINEDNVEKLDFLDRQEKNAIKDFCKIYKRKSYGKTNDHLRTAGLKIIANLVENIQHQGHTLKILKNEPRHLIRAIPPSTLDIIFANRLGTLAVDNAMAGYEDCLISQWLTEYVLVPLKLVILGRKRIPKKGIFWKSVVAKTGQ